jgi:hypothetical protein
MKSLEHAAAIFSLTTLLAACGGSSGEQERINTDYSALGLATSREGNLHYATTAEEILHPLRNGLRLSLRGFPEVYLAIGVTTPSTSIDTTYSTTTVQVAGVDEADLVKYDGEHIYALRTESVPPPLAAPGTSRNVLKIARTNPSTAEVQVVAEFVLEGEQSSLPLLYQQQSDQGETVALAAVSQYNAGWWIAQPQVTSLVVQPDRTTIQVLDVSDPRNVFQAWEIELDGWLRTSRKIDDTLYVVTSYRPRLAGLVFPADTDEKKEANERRIRDTTANELLPQYRDNGGSPRPLARAQDCVVAALAPNEAYADLVIVTAVSLSERRITDVNCVSTNVNGVYVSRKTLYVGGEGARDGAPATVLHKFALDDGNIAYSASGIVTGRIGWRNASYFIDEHEGDVRIVTSSHAQAGDSVHRLTVLREGACRCLEQLATLPNARRNARIGKPGEQVHAVRFFGDRGYVVTARVTDPLYVIDLRDPADPLIAGELEIPGVATYLHPLGSRGSELLFSVGRLLNGQGVPTGVKVELFDVANIAQPRSLGAEVLGQAGSSSEATDDPHAVAVLSRADTGLHRFALPVNVFETPHPSQPGVFRWTYSGIHLLEVDGRDGGTPQLKSGGVIKTAEPDDTRQFPPHVAPHRAVLHDESAFAIYGDAIIGRTWTSSVSF